MGLWPEGQWLPGQKGGWVSAQPGAEAQHTLGEGGCWGVLVTPGPGGRAAAATPPKVC